MKFLSEFRDPALARKLVSHIEKTSTKEARLMEFLRYSYHGYLQVRHPAVITSKCQNGFWARMPGLRYLGQGYR